MYLNVWTWNINSVRSKIKRVNELLEKFDIDILFLTETKIKPEHEESLVFYNKDVKYKVIFNSNKIKYYHGTAFVYRPDLNIELICDKLTCYGMNEKHKDDIHKAYNTEGRIITIKCIISLENNSLNLNSSEKQEIIICGNYTPNSGSDRKEPLKRLPFRVCCWDRDIQTYLLELNKIYKNVIWLGDLNVCRKNNDMRNPKQRFAGTTKEERDSMNTFIVNSKWRDCWDELNPTVITYDKRATYGIGTTCLLRLDYIITSPQVNCVSCGIDQTFDGSDHIPIGAIFKF